jgi:DNA mismatch repair protein MutL
LFKQDIHNPFPTLQSKANDLGSENTGRTKMRFVPVTQGYIGITRADGLMVIHQKRAYQRILFEQFIDSLEKKNGPSQQLLFPETLQLNPSDKLLFLEILEEIKHLGFDLSPNPDGTYSISGIPTTLGEESPQEIIEDLLEQLKHESSEKTVLNQEKLARIMANRTAAKFHLKSLSEEEMQSLIERLFASSQPTVSPNGDLISKLLDKHFLEHWLV